MAATTNPLAAEAARPAVHFPSGAPAPAVHFPSDAPAPAVHFPPSPGFTTVAFEGPRLGLSLTLVRTPALGGGCSVRVEALLDGSPAAAAGVRPGHCLVLANNRAVAPPTDACGSAALTASLQRAARPLRLAFAEPPADERAPLRTVNLAALFASGRAHLGLEPAADGSGGDHGLRERPFAGEFRRMPRGARSKPPAVRGDGRVRRRARLLGRRPRRAGRRPRPLRPRLGRAPAAGAAGHAGDNGLDGAWDGPLPPLPGLADLPSTPEADGHGAADELDADAVRQSGVGLVVAGVEAGEAKTVRYETTATDRAVASFLAKRKRAPAADAGASLDRDALVAISTFKRLLVAGLPVLKHGRNGERREIVLRPTKHFDGVRWASRRGQAAGTCLFAEMASVDPAVEPHVEPPTMAADIAPVLKRNCRPAELARSFSLRLKSGGDRAALDFTAPSKEYYALLTDGLNGVLLRPDKIVRHEAKRDRLVDVLRAEAEREARAARLRMLRPDYCSRARHTIRRARSVRAASRAKLSTQQLHSYAQSQRRLEHLHGLVHLYDDKHIPHDHVHRYPLAEGTYCELLFNANLSYGSSQPDVDVAPLVAVLEAKFTEGCYVKCRVVTYKKEQTAAALAADDVEAGGTYALRYVDGPFDLDDDEALSEAEKALFQCDADGKPFGDDEGCPLEFKDVRRAHVVVDYRDLPANYWPAFIVLVSVVELGFFFYYGSKAETGISMAEPVGGPEDLWFRVFEPFSKASDRCGRVRPGYRVWSYSLVHRGLQHVLFNTVIQCIFGIPMEMVHGTRTLFLTYYMGVTLGALFAAAWVPYGSLVGASGGVYCFMGVHMGNLALNWRRMHRGLLNNWRRLGIYAFLLGIDFAQYFGSGGGETTSHAAHAGGYLAGFCVPFIFFTDVDSENWFHHQVLRPLAIAFTGLMWIHSAVFLLVPPVWPARSFEEHAPCCMTLLGCDALDQADYGRFSCKDGWQLNWPGFFDTHASDASGTCAEMAAYVASR
ncbi:hypothetical protein JL721_9444 [Aureococcus anophagefferens]|nr:hypothetical protein JL721_9444 [Aureococcus anophagefferens]